MSYVSEALWLLWTIFLRSMYKAGHRWTADLQQMSGVDAVALGHIRSNSTPG